MKQWPRLGWFWKDPGAFAKSTPQAPSLSLHPQQQSTVVREAACHMHPVADLQATLMLFVGCRWSWGQTCSAVLSKCQGSRVYSLSWLHWGSRGTEQMGLVVSREKGHVGHHHRGTWRSSQQLVTCSPTAAEWQSPPWPPTSICCHCFPLFSPLIYTQKVLKTTK